jgi:hypothetical protein
MSSHWQQKCITWLNALCAIDPKAQTSAKILLRRWRILVTVKAYHQILTSAMHIIQTIQTEALVDCPGSGIIHLCHWKLIHRHLHVLVKILMMIFHSCELRMLGQRTMLRGHDILKNASVQLKLGVGTDGPFHYYAWPITTVMLLQHYVRRQPHVLTYKEICCSIENLPLTLVKTSHKDRLYPRSFWVFYLMSFFSTSLFRDKIKVELFRQGFYYVHSWQSNARHGGEECPAHAYISIFVWKGGSIYLLKIHWNRLR